MILVYITFFVGVLYYILSSEERSYAFATFLVGCLLGVIVCIFLALISLNSMENSASIWIETSRIYLQYFFIPLVISVPLFLLFSFSLSEETFALTPTMVLGLLTIVFIKAIFSNRTEVESFKLEILLISFFISVFLYEFLIKLSLTVLPLSPVTSFLLASVIFLALCYPIALILASYHFTNAKIITFSVLSLILLLMSIPQKFFLFLK